MKINKKTGLMNFYTPSQEMKKYEYLWIILGISGVGLIYAIKGKVWICVSSCRQSCANCIAFLHCQQYSILHTIK
jgi:hypothetical protein